MSLVLAEAGKNTRNAMARMLKATITSILFCVLLSYSSGGWAQSSGKVRIQADPRLETELQKEIEHNDSTEIKGYRIQIYFGNNRTEAEKIERKFKNLFPDYKNETYLRYYQPYWRVRIGNYYRKIDAQNLLHQLTEEFENVLLIKDEIELPEIKTEE